MTLNNDNNNECCKCTTPEYELILNEQGPQGRQGNPGKDGISPKIAVASNSYGIYTLNIQTSDGTFTTPNLKASFPAGGNAGDVLGKNSNADGDVGWINTEGKFVTLDSDQTIEGHKQFYGDGLRVISDDYQNYQTVAELKKDMITPAGNGKVTLLEYKYIPNKVAFQTIPVRKITGSSQDEYYNLLDESMIEAGNNIHISYSQDNNHLIINALTQVPSIATTSSVGVVKPDGTTITIDEDGTIHGASTYELPIASTTTLGGIKVGQNLSISDDGTLSATGGELPSNVLTSDNISQDAYIQALEARIAALEALINGGNATND